MESFANSTAPASRSRSTTVASTSSTWFSYGFAPQVVRMPLVAKRSFAPHGMPCSGPRYRPLSPCRPRRLRQREILGQRHDALQRIAVLLQAGEIHLGQLGGVTRRVRMRDASTVTGSNASSSSDDVTRTCAGRAVISFAWRVEGPPDACPEVGPKGERWLGVERYVELRSAS